MKKIGIQMILLKTAILILLTGYDVKC